MSRAEHRYWLMSTTALPALWPYLLPLGKISRADYMVHQWVRAELKRMRDAAANLKAA
jgi:hypothetical protein